MVHLIVAMTPVGVIGNNGTLPWHIPADLKHFKALTRNCSVIMGRKTFDSLNMPDGLPNRYNIVISRTPHEETSIMAPISWAVNLVDAVERAKLSSAYRDIFIIGGATIYKEALDKKLVDKMHISFVKEHYDGDTKFPEFDKTEWEEGEHIDKGDFVYIQYNRKNKIKSKKIEMTVKNCGLCPFCEYNPHYGMSYNSGYDCNNEDSKGSRIADDVGSKSPDLKTLPIPEWCGLPNST